MMTSLEDNDDRLDALGRRLELATNDLEKLTRQFSSGGIERVLTAAFKKQEALLQRQLQQLLKEALFGASSGKGRSAQGGVLSTLLSVIPGFARGGILNRATPIAHTAEHGPEVVLPLKKTRDGRLGVATSSSGGGSIKDQPSSTPPLHITVVNSGAPVSADLSGDDQAALAEAVIKAVEDAIDHRIDAQLRDGGLLDGLNSSRMFRS
jgi:phage-related minor tail protein